MTDRSDAIGWREQIRRNAVALISLAIALTSLGYNTWRNETTEQQRNIRHAAFLLVEHSGRLQSVVNGMVYADRDDAWVDGWGEVLAIKSLGQLMPEPVPQHANQAFKTWEQQFANLQSSDAEVRQSADGLMHAAIVDLNDAVVAAIANLD